MNVWVVLIKILGWIMVHVLRLGVYHINMKTLQANIVRNVRVIVKYVLVKNNQIVLSNINPIIP